MDVRKTLLVVDDDPTAISGLVGILGDRYQLLIAKSAGEAEALLSDRLDLVLLDLYLGGGSDGIDLLRTIKSKPSMADVPVVCLTVSQKDADVVRSFSEGAIDYITKPYQRSILLSKIGTFLELKEKTEKLQRENLEDPLTEVGNRRRFDRALVSEERRMSREGSPLGLLLVDIDQFKSVNDTHGHAGGDAVLKCLAQLLSGCFGRSADVVARIGGDEFAVLLPGRSLSALKADARRLAESLKDIHEAAARDEGRCPDFTVSIGCASIIPKDEQSAAWLLGEADARLYEAKANRSSDTFAP